MNNRVFLVIGVLVGAVAVYLLTRGQGPVRTASPGAQNSVTVADAIASDAVASGSRRVAFIDLQTVFNSCKQNKAFESEMGKFVSDGHAQLGPKVEPLENEIERLKEKVNLLGEGSSDRAPLIAQIKQKSQELSELTEPWERDLKKQNLLGRDTIYQTIRKATERIARARGFDLVFADVEDPRPNLEAANAREMGINVEIFMTKVNRKSVLYAAKEVDLTKEVLEAVNAEP